MNPEIRFTSEEYDCPVTQCMETVKIKHSTNRPKSVDADTVGQTIGEYKLKTPEDCTGIDECSVKEPHNSGARFHWEHCPLTPILKGE